MNNLYLVISVLSKIQNQYEGRLNKILRIFVNILTPTKSTNVIYDITTLMNVEQIITAIITTIAII